MLLRKSICKVPRELKSMHAKCLKLYKAVTQKPLLWKLLIDFPCLKLYFSVLILMVREAPPNKKQCIFGHCPNCDLTPLIAQIRALCGTITPQRYLFFGSTRYYTIFCNLIRLSHDISDIL